jgi:hypothetical protein
MQRCSYATATACLVAPTCAHPKEQQLQEFFCPKNGVLGKKFSLGENRGIVAVSALQMCMHNCYEKDPTKNLLSFDKEATFFSSFISEHYAPTELVEITHVFVITLFFSSAVWLFPQQKSFTWVSSFFPRILEPRHEQWQTNKAKKNKRTRELCNNRLMLVWRWHTLHRSMIGK